MMKYRIQNAEQALAYVTDCNLATVCDLAMKKSRPKGEFQRQISIAQESIEWMIRFNVDYSTTRAKDVVEDYQGSVKKWAEQFYPESFGKKHA